MKLLVVDDSPKRYGQLVDRLVASGFRRDDIVVVVSAEGARRELEARSFDLMLLDILLPLRDVEEADYQHSVDLLTELVDSNDLRRPPHIVGITSDPASAAKASPIFAEHLWTVIAYSESSDEWMTQLLNCAIYVREISATQKRDEYGVDLAVVCALPDPELKQVLELPWNFKAARPVDESLFVHDGNFASAGQNYTVCAVAAPRMGLVSAALTTQRVVKALRPRMLAMTGICAGVSGKVALGDVIFVDPAWDWQSGKYLREAGEAAQHLLSPHQVGPSSEVRAYADQMRSDRQFLSSVMDAAPDPAPGRLQLYLGPVASGAAVIADSNVTSEIKAQHRDTCGIEMECYGFFSAALSASHPRPIPFAFKAVCDFADALKNDKHQRYASYASARVMQEYVERYAHAMITSQRAT